MNYKHVASLGLMVGLIAFVFLILPFDRVEEEVAFSDVQKLEPLLISEPVEIAPQQAVDTLREYRDSFHSRPLREQRVKSFELAESVASLPSNHPFRIQVAEVLVALYLDDSISNSNRVHISSIIEQFELYSTEISDFTRMSLLTLISKGALHLDDSELKMVALFEVPGFESTLDQVISSNLSVDDSGSFILDKGADRLSAEAWTALLLKARYDPNSAGVLLGVSELTNINIRPTLFQSISAIEDEQVEYYFIGYAFSDEKIIRTSDRVEPNEYIAWYAIKALSNYYSDLPINTSTMDLPPSRQLEDIEATREWLNNKFSSEIISSAIDLINAN